METPASAITVRERVLLELARRNKTDVPATFRALTEASAVVLDVARVSIWELVGNDGSPGSKLDARLVCKDLYLLHERKHVTFMPICGVDLRAYLSASYERRTVTADDAQRDPRTRDFTAVYLRPLGITSMMDVPVWRSGHVYGVLCFEHVGPIRHWQTHEEDFAINMTEIASASLHAAEHEAVMHRLDTGIETLAEAVGILDARGTIVRCNHAAWTFVERAGAQTWEEVEANMELLDAADRPIPVADRPFRRALNGEVVRGEIYGFVFTKTGERGYVRVTCSPLFEEGRVKHVVIVAVDATDEVFVERMKREIISVLAHEVKTPLAIAKGYAQQLEKSSGLRAGCGAMIAPIVRACDRVDHLTETLLDLGTIVLGRLRLTRERVDLGELALSVIRRAERGAPSHRFQLDTSSSIPVILDCARIALAMRQIIDNAIVYSPAGSTIGINLASDEKKATLSVRDRGIGIPADAQRSIFTPFFKAHAGTKHDKGGLGVGLYLAREIVRRHGGEISFESVEGRGSTFFMTLPRPEAP